MRAFLLFFLVALIAGPATADMEVAEPKTACALFSDLDGDWIGSWINNFFQSTGDASISLDIDASASTAAVTLDVDGFVFGAQDPPAETFNGSFDGTGVNFSGTSVTFGDFTFSIDCLGNMTAEGTNVPNPGIDRVTFSGTATAGAINTTYEVFFSGAGGSVDGSFSFTPAVPVEPVNLGVVKEKFAPKD